MSYNHSLEMKRRWKNPKFRRHMRRIHKNNHMRALWRKSWFRNRTIKAVSKHNSRRLKWLWKLEEYRKEQSDRQVRRWKEDKKYVKLMRCRFKSCPSKPQLHLFYRLRSSVGKIGLKSEFPIGSYSIDIASTEKKLGIEVDGSYWHKYRSRGDKWKRTRFLHSEGWKILRISSEEVDKKFKKAKTWFAS